MWMVGGYNEASHHHHHNHHQQLNLDTFNGRKLRPLIPRPATLVPSPDFGLYTPGVGEQGISNKNINNNNNNLKEEVSNGGTSRWNPTAEQLRTLEDLYRRGTRTPSTDQIQRITAQLRRYGKIEGKNVFYWFQNHKARERQKRRRDLQLLSPSSHHNYHHSDDPILGIGLARKQIFTGHAEQTRARYAAEESGIMSMQRAAAEKGDSENRSRHQNIGIGSSAVACLFQVDDHERNGTWQNLGSPNFTCITTTSTIPTTTISDHAAVAFKTRRFIASLRDPIPETTTRQVVFEDQDNAETLELFPLRSQVQNGQQQEHEDKSKETDLHFFEFLPPKLN